MTHQDYYQAHRYRYAEPGYWQPQSPVPAPQPPRRQRWTPGQSVAMVAVGVASVLVIGGTGVAVGHATVPDAVPAPVVTVTAKPVSDSREVLYLKLAWVDMDAKNQADVRDLWRNAKGSQAGEERAIKTVAEAVGSVKDYAPTRADLRAFLDWTLEN